MPLLSRPTVAASVLAIALTTIAMIVLAPSAPDQVAIHFGADGTADGFASPWAVVAGTLLAQLVLGAVMGLASASVGDQVVGGRVVEGFPAGMVTFLGVGAVWVMVANAGAAAESVVSLPGLAIPAAFIAAVAVGWAVSRLVPEGDPGPAVMARPTDDALRLDLDGGVAVWQGLTPVGRAMPAVVFALLVVLLGSFLIAGSATLGVVGLGLLPALAFSRFRVTVGPGGVRVRSVVGWPAAHLSLEHLTHAEVIDARLRDYGGWGWRVRRNSTAVLTRPGPAVRLVRSDNKDLVITLDDPATVAGLVNTLLDRREDHGAAASGV